MSERWEGAVIETYSGRAFDIADPDSADIELRDIAAGLAHTCRFGGHCSRFYSVAHHSLHVSRELPRDDTRLRFLGLLHDAAEAYIGDVPRPIKANVDGFRRAEEGILEAVWEAFDVAPPTDEEWAAVETADDRLLAYEANRLLEDASWASDAPALEYDLDSSNIDGIRDSYRRQAETLLDRLE